MCKSDKKCKAKGCDKSRPEGKWFNDLSILEFRKSLLMPKEIDSLKAFHHRANEFLGRKCDQNDPALPSTPAEAHTLGRQLMELHLPAEAEHWLKMAAEEGITEAQVDYGLALSSVDDYEPSFEEAAKWFEKDASQGSAEGLFQALNIYEGNGYRRLKCSPKHYRTVIKFTPEECGASEEKAEDARRRLTDLADRDVPKAVVWYATEHNDMDVLFDAAERGMVLAMSTLANRYYQQCIACDDPVGEAVRWAEMAAEKGDANSLLGLGLLYKIGFGVEHSPEKAFRYTKQAAELGLAGGRVELGKMYFDGDCVKQSYKKTREWFMTADQCAESEYYLGEIFRNGLGVEHDDAIALQWYRLAAEKRHSRAMTKLGIMYSNGQGVEKDIQTALSYIQDASRYDNPLARDIENCL